MGKKKACVNCGRSIDETARACLYCNWWQSEPVTAKPLPTPAVDYVPPPDNRARNKLIGIIGFAVLLVIVFIIGAFVHGADRAKAGQPNNITASWTPPEPRTTVTLVPVTEGAPPPPTIEPPVTNVASSGAPTTSPANDVTALPSDQYAAAAKRTRAAPPAGSTVDPRSITGAAYSGASRSTHPRPIAHIAETQPIPLFQPVPHVRVDREATAQLYLTVGTDGLVHDIDVQRAVPGVMGPLVGEVQNWRFRPATDNGTPVASRFSVAVTFRP